MMSWKKLLSSNANLTRNLPRPPSFGPTIELNKLYSNNYGIYKFFTLKNKYFCKNDGKWFPGIHTRYSKIRFAKILIILKELKSIFALKKIHTFNRLRFKKFTKIIYPQSQMSQSQLQSQMSQSQKSQSQKSQSQMSQSQMSQSQMSGYRWKHVYLWIAHLNT